MRGRKLKKFIIRRILVGLFTLFIIVSLTFFLITLAPGDPIMAKCQQMSESARVVAIAKYGLDKPVLVRYGIYMKNLILHGDLGESFIYVGRSVQDTIQKTAPISAKIGGIALLIQVFIGVIIGTFAAMNREKVTDQVIRVAVVLAICVPSFVFASLLQYYIAFKLKWLPIFGWGKPEHYVMPVIAMGIGGLAGYTKYMRNSTIGVMNEDYIVTAKAKGVTKGRLIRKHILRNALIPVITMLGPSIAAIFGGSFILESIFGIAGMGSSYVKAVQDSDYSLILGQTVFFAAIYIIALIFVDIMYGIVDPRIRLARDKN